MEFGEILVTRKPKNLLVRYPQPYSKSWNEEKDRKKKNVNHNRNMKTKSFETPCQRYTAMRRQMQQRFRGPDPTLPHLKYGVFPKRPNRTIPTKIEVPMKKPAPSEPIEPYKRERKRTVKKGVTSKDSELVVFKTMPLDKRLMRQLTVSTSTHVDIKPQRFSMIARNARNTGQTYY